MIQSEYLAERLARDHPDQYERVRSGELSVNAAAVLAGIRPRRVSVRTDDAASAAESLHRNMANEVFVELAERVRRLATTV